ncbi:hypothetical protein AB9F36_11650 [Rhizobium leguminosarum]|uniref:hypothetical protein n=1 Tax=Rhizobium leguminosarum TaxID=384 RepID=UPI003F99B26D
MFQFLRKSSACLRIVIAATASITLSPLQVFAVELDKMFDSLEPAYTTIAGAEECDLRLEIGLRVWRYAEMRVKDLEARSGLSDEQLSSKREAAKVEGRQVAAIGACGSVLVAFQALDELRKATGHPYSDDDAASTATLPSPKANALAKKEHNAQSLMREWMHAYIACRGGSGDQESTWAACDKREEVAEKLAKQGYCEETRANGPPNWIDCRSQHEK